MVVLQKNKNMVIKLISIYSTEEYGFPTILQLDMANIKPYNNFATG